MNNTIYSFLIESIDRPDDIEVVYCSLDIRDKLFTLYDINKIKSNLSNRTTNTSDLPLRQAPLKIIYLNRLKRRPRIKIIPDAKTIVTGVAV
jgi:hypothetical protein